MNISGKRVLITGGSSGIGLALAWVLSAKGAKVTISGRRPEAVADAQGIETGALEVIRGGEARAQMVALNRQNPSAVDDRFLGLKPALEEAVKDHSAL